MIHEFAVSPKLFSEVSEIKFLCQSFGCGKGRLISDIPNKVYQREILKVINNSKNRSVMRKSMKNAAKKLLRKAIYKRNTQPKMNDQRWINYVKVAHDERPFRAVIINSNEDEPGSVPFINNDLELIDNDLWNVPKDIIIERQSKIMIQAIKPMIDCSNELILVDRYFNPAEERFTNVLFEFIQVVVKRSFSPAIKKITYHVEEKHEKTMKSMKSNFQEHILKFIPEDFKFQIVVWPKNKLHDRFILSNIGGISLGHGLDEFDGRGAKEVRINILSEQSYKYWWKECKSKSPTFMIQK